MYLTVALKYVAIMPEPDALFEPDGRFLFPTQAALGPWRPDALHGGAVSALFGHYFEREGWIMARMTMDLMGRVPLGPLRLTSGQDVVTRRLLRRTVSLWSDDRMVAKAEALMLPELALALPPQPQRRLDLPGDLNPDPQSTRSTIVERVGYPSFVSHAVSTHKRRLDEVRPKAIVYWIRLLLPAIAGQSITPVQRACAAADYANGGFATLPFEEWSFVSLDLTVQLVRVPSGDWVAVTNNSLAESTGVGLGDAELYDGTGRIGRATATLLVERRGEGEGTLPSRG
jgi:hypothetical protein